MLAVVFPGQGAQEVGMSVDFADGFPEARDVLKAADSAFEGPLSRWIREGPEERLRRTEVTQPAVLAASLAIYRVLESRLPVAPAFFAGHSLGEYTALAAAGALSLEDAVRLVRRRGALMQEAVPEGEGAMVAVLGLAAAEVDRVCDETPGAYAANYNAAAQTVVAGERKAVEAAAERLREAGARRIIPLEVSAPFHCPLMAPARDKLAAALAEVPFRDLQVPVISNVTGRPYRRAEEARELLREQVCAPVRWMECVRTLAREGVQVQLEVGPGSVLTALAARIEPGLVRGHVSNAGGLGPALNCVAEAHG
jgi:[acyl-carrier-protein] S-malonyltransferase